MQRYSVCLFLVVSWCALGAHAFGAGENSQTLQVRAEAAQPGYLPLRAERAGRTLTLTAQLPREGEGMGAQIALAHGIQSARHIWLPHLTPEPGYVIGDHSFRSPAIIFSNAETALALIPDIDDIAVIQKSGLRVWMDYDHPSMTITVAVGAYDTSGPHLSYHPTSVKYAGQRVRLRLHVLESRKPEDLENPYGMAAGWLWARWGRTLYGKGGSQTAPVSKYCEHVTHWTFTPEPKGWSDTVWQDVSIFGRKCGAPAFIVDVSQHPSKPLSERRWRETRSVWNQAWFSTQRCANGLARYARQTNSRDLRERARLMTQFALAAPQTDGLFPSVYAAVDSSTPAWGEGFWGNSNRRPSDATEQAYHILDSSFTARLLLEWEDMAGMTRRIQDRVLAYADRLCRLQRNNGAFPGWVEPDGKVAETLAEGPETAMSAALLLEMVQRFPKHSLAPRWQASAASALEYLEKGPVAEGRWEDFETYFSCSTWGKPGERVARNGVYKSNTLSMFWCAEAFLRAYQVFGEERYLSVGRRCLDEMSLYQQVWNPAYIPARCHGGFGVMNFDGEWNDARQSLFAPIFLEYYKATGKRDYFERGVSALRASFAMLYCPENNVARKAYERRHPFFGPETYGFMMENVCHGGPQEEPIGVFTIFTWGNGAALATAALVRDLYGDVFIDTKRKASFGIDGCAAVLSGGDVVVKDRFNRRSLTAVYADGNRRIVTLTNGSGRIPLSPRRGL